MSDAGSFFKRPSVERNAGLPQVCSMIPPTGIFEARPFDPETGYPMAFLTAWQSYSQPPSGGHCEEDEGHEPGEGAINAHAVGIGWHKGKQVLVRTDVR